jgi:quercetin dioxygenase-like cupin family protein
VSGYGQAVVLGPGEGDDFQIGLDHVVVKGATSHPGEGFSVVEYHGATQPGPPPHVHRTFEEAWFILEGEVDFWLDRQTIHGRPGSFLLVPRGSAHTFQVTGGRPARWIGIFSPGRYMELIRELGKLIPADGPPAAAAVAELFARYDTEIVEAAPAQP